MNLLLTDYLEFDFDHDVTFFEMLRCGMGPRTDFFPPEFSCHDVLAREELNKRISANIISTRGGTPDKIRDQLRASPLRPLTPAEFVFLFSGFREVLQSLGKEVLILGSDLMARDKKNDFWVLVYDPESDTIVKRSHEHIFPKDSLLVVTLA